MNIWLNDVEGDVVGANVIGELVGSLSIQNKNISKQYTYYGYMDIFCT